MKKIVLALFLTFPISAYETPVSNEEIPCNPRVAVYIPARIGSTRIPQKMLQSIDGQTVIERTYNRAKFIRRANRVCAVTNSLRIASLIGEDALFINKEYASSTERICDAFFNYSDPKEEIIVNVQGDEPYIEPAIVDFAIQKFIECEDDPSVAAVFLYYAIPTEEAKKPNTVKLVMDQNNYLLYGSRSVIPYGDCSRYFNHIGIMVYRKDALKKFWKHPNTPLETSEDLHWMKFLEMGYKIKAFEISHPVERDVNVPDDLTLLSDKYSKPRIYLIRSGSFSQYFVEKTNTLWPLRSGDLVCRSKDTTGNNLDLFNGRVDYAFFRQGEPFVDPGTLKPKTFTAQPSDTSIAVVKAYELSRFPLKQFCTANQFQHGEMVNTCLLAADYEIGTGLEYDANKIGHIPSLGFIAISYLHRRFPNHLIVLIDFTFEGTYQHQWEKEKQYALKLEREGHLIRLLDKVQTK